MSEPSPTPTTVPILLEPIPNESAASFLSRVAEANWYDRVSWLRQEGKTRRWDIAIWPDDIRLRVATLTGLDIETFDALCYALHREPGRLESQRHFLDSRVPAVLLDTEKRKFCPLCLPVDGIHPAFFDLTAITVCPRHNVRLEDSCRACGHELRWGSRGVLKCEACSSDLASTEPTRIPLADAAGAAAIAQRAGFDLQGAEAPVWPAGTEHFDLGQSIEFLTVLARLATDHRDTTGFLHFSRGDANDRVRLGCEVMAEWPTGYHRCLDAIAVVAKQDPRTLKSRQKLFGFARIYGEFYNRLTMASDEPWLFLKTAFARYAGVQSVTPITGRHDGAVFTATDIADRPVITPKEGRDVSGLKYYKMKRLLDTGAVPSKIAVGGKRSRVFVDRADVEALMVGGAPITKKDTAALLGVPNEKMTQFIDDDVLKPLAGPANDGGKRYLFAPADVNEFIAALRGMIAEADNFPPNTALSTVLRGQETLRTSSKPVIDAMRDGTLAVRGWDEERTGIAGAMFHHREVDRFLQIVHDRERGDIDGLTTVRVSHIIAVNPMTAVWLLDKGLLTHGPATTTKKAEGAPRLANCVPEWLRHDNGNR